MTDYLKPSFSVAQRGRDPAQCSHGWRTPRGACVFCGANPEAEERERIQAKARRRYYRRRGIRTLDDLLRHHFQPFEP